MNGSSEEYLESLLQSIMNGESKSSSEEESDVLDSQPDESGIETEEDTVHNSEPYDLDTSGMNDLSPEEAGENDTISDDLGNMSLEDTGTDAAISDGFDMDGMDLEQSGMNDLGMDDIGLSDLLASDTGTDDLLSDGMGTDDLLSDGIGTDDTFSDDIGLSDLLASDMGTDDLLSDSIGTDDTFPDDIGLSDLLSDDMGADGLLSDSYGADDITLEEHHMDDMALEEHSMEDMVPDDVALEEPGMGGLFSDGIGADNIALEEHHMDDMELEELGMDDNMDLDAMLADSADTNDDIALDELSLGDDIFSGDGQIDAGEGNTGADEMDLGELNLDDMALGDTGVDDMGLDDLGLDDMMLDDTGMDDMLTDDSGFGGAGDEFALEEQGMDDDLAEIHDLLDQSGQKDEIDDEMLALLESVSDPSEDGMGDVGGDEFGFLQNVENADGASASGGGEETPQDTPPEEKKRKKKLRRKKKKGENVDADSPEEVSEQEAGEDAGAEVEKKPGAFARFLAFLTESEEDDAEDADEEGLTDENGDLLAELEPDRAKGKKGKKDKKKKDKEEKKGKKGKNVSEEEGEEESKPVKKKKPKKEKKKKEEGEEAPQEAPGRKLSKKKVISVVLFSATVLAGILILTVFVPDYLQKRDAQVAYDMGNYEETFELLYGKKLNEEEELILHKSTIILTMERKLSSYWNYCKMEGRELDALNALLQGASLYHGLILEAEQYYVTDEIRAVYDEILAVLSEQYALSETDVMEITESGDDTTYTQRLMSIVYGTSFDEGAGTVKGGIEDMLPEEQEILDALPTDQTGQEISGDMSDDRNDAQADNMDQTGDVPADGDVIRYIDPVSVEIHQN